jgi:hypothetical protein
LSRNDDRDQTTRDIGSWDYTLKYDYEYQLTSCAGQYTATFTYDALGRRMSRSYGGTTTTYCNVS